MNKRLLLISLSFFLFLKPAFAIDFWQYPEAADKGSIFASAFAASLVISSPGLDGIDFSFIGPDFCLDYVLPIGLPFSFGASFRAEGDFFAFGLRPSYYINLDTEWLGLYAIYPISFIFLEGAPVIKYGLGIGARARVKDFFCLSAEISPSLKSLLLGASFKLF